MNEIIYKLIGLVGGVFGLLIYVSGAQAATISVGPVNDVVQYDYHTIQEAVDIATGQDLIYVTAGEYNENVVIPKNSEIRITGEIGDPSSVVLHGNITFQDSASNTAAVLEDFTIKADGLQYAIQSSQNISLRDMRIRGGNDGVIMKAGNIDINNSFIRRAQHHGLVLQKAAGSLWVYTSTFKKNKAAGIRIDGNFYGRITNSNFLSNRKGLTLKDAELLNAGSDYGLKDCVLRHNFIGVLLINSTMNRSHNTFENNTKDIVTVSAVN